MSDGLFCLVLFTLVNAWWTDGGWHVEMRRHVILDISLLLFGVHS